MTKDAVIYTRKTIIKTIAIVALVLCGAKIYDLNEISKASIEVKTTCSDISDPEIIEPSFFNKALGEKTIVKAIPYLCEESKSYAGVSTFFELAAIISLVLLIPVPFFFSAT